MYVRQPCARVSRITATEIHYMLIRTKSMREGERESDHAIRGSSLLGPKYVPCSLTSLELY